MSMAGPLLEEASMHSGSKADVKGGRFSGVGGGVGVAEAGGEAWWENSMALSGTRVVGTGMVGRRRGWGFVLGGRPLGSCGHDDQSSG